MAGPSAKRAHCLLCSNSACAWPPTRAQVVFPLYDPATIITIGVYATSSKGVRAMPLHTLRV